MIQFLPRHALYTPTHIVFMPQQILIGIKHIQGTIYYCNFLSVLNLFISSNSLGDCHKPTSLQFFPAVVWLIKSDFFVARSYFASQMPNSVAIYGKSCFAQFHFFCVSFFCAYMIISLRENITFCGKSTFLLVSAQFLFFTPPFWLLKSTTIRFVRKYASNWIKS